MHKITPSKQCPYWEHDLGINVNKDSRPSAIRVQIFSDIHCANISTQFCERFNVEFIALPFQQPTPPSPPAQA